MELERVSAASDPLAARVLDEREGGLFHSPPWALALADAYGLRVEMIAAGGQAAGISFCRIDDLAGRRIVSLPFSDFCDPLVETREQWDAVAGELLRDGCPVTVRCLHNRIPLDDARFETVKKASWHEVDVRPEEDRLFGNMAESVRRSVRKARREGVTLQPLGDADFLREFHAMHVSLRKDKYRLMAQPMLFFEAVRRRFREADGWFPLAAMRGGRVIAAVILLRWKSVLYYKFGASRLDALDARPNDFLMWESIRLARRLGCGRLDLGLSDDDQPGLVRFKSNLGGRSGGIRFLKHTPEGWNGGREKAFRTLSRRITELVTDPRAPDSLSVSASRALYRHLA